MIKDIETVCYGNHFRSRLAEAVLKRELKRRGINHVNITSSGTGVDRLKEYYAAKEKGRESELEAMVPVVWAYLKEAVKYGVITTAEAEAFRKGEGREEVYDKVIKAGVKNPREKVVEDMGLGYFFDFDSEQRQTIVRAEAELILPFSQNDLERVEGIYAPLKDNPIIVLPGDVEDPFFGEYEDALSAGREVERLTVQEVERVFG